MINIPSSSRTQQCARVNSLRFGTFAALIGTLAAAAAAAARSLMKIKLSSSTADFGEK